ncbi:MAG: HEPN domain-containing protein [Oscillospiraceae bacterium]|jgi:HEPN domain-containing protein|nr:HEPN domain-containing protein [Oscillospiraceae bacterium]
MTTDEKYEYWLEIAQYDLESADVMFGGGRWLYVLFMCQQAIEKLVKGLYTVYLGEIPPKTHNIALLVKRVAYKFPEVISDEHTALFDTLSKYYLNNRYPDYMSKLSEQTDKSETERVLIKSKEAFAWLLTMKR